MSWTKAEERQARKIAHNWCDTWGNSDYHPDCKGCLCDDVVLIIREFCGKLPVKERRGIEGGCGRFYCSASTDICGNITFGHGELDPNGFWQWPCKKCEEAWRRKEAFDSCWRE